MIDIKSPDWFNQLIEASNQADASTIFANETSVISLAISRKYCVFALTGGRVSEAAADAEVEVKIPVKYEQLIEIVDGTTQLSAAYMKGEIKPVGSSRALLHAIELFDNPNVQQHLNQYVQSQPTD